MEGKKINSVGLKEAIIRVIAFFNMFDYPLTAREIWLNLSVKCELSEVTEILEGDIEKIGHLNGFYFLAGQEKNVIERLNRYSFTDRKFKRAILVAKIFRLIPWIKMIAVGNLLGAHNLKDDSDIDFFIITEDKQIWLTRFFCASIAKLLGLRPRPDKSRDKICLSFYVSGKAMDLKGLMLKSYQKEKNENVFRRPVSQYGAGCGWDDEEGDIYFIHWLAGLTPIFDTGEVYDKFLEANLWLKKYLPNWQPANISDKRKVKPFLSEFYHDLISLFIGGLEPQFKDLQLRWLPLSLKNLMNVDSRVVITHQVIKMHANDRREEYKNKFNQKIKDLR